jgi:plasmid stabilization system protein ParE
MKLRWHPEARAEADAAAAFYKDKQPGLALRFLDSLEEALHRIQRHPQAYRQLDGEVRRCRVRHFPYGVIYRVRTGSIEVIAVMHLRRSPDYWKARSLGP